MPPFSQFKQRVAEIKKRQ